MHSRTLIHLLGALALTIASSISMGNPDSEFTVEDFRLNSAQELVDICLADNDHPQYGTDQAVDAIFRGLVDKWPCASGE